jgi:penicillin-binding protein 2
MINDHQPVTEAQQQLTFSRRALVLRGTQLAIGGVLAARMGWISIAENERYSLLAESNRVNLTLIPPRRGWIVDRVGKPLALNRTSFRVDIIPDRLQDKDGVLAELQRLMAIEPDDMERIREEIKRSPGFQPIQIGDNLDWETFAAVSVRQADLPGVAPAQSFARYYPEGGGVGHLLGYVGTASSKDYEKNKNQLLITPGFKVGKEGLEKTLDMPLRGKPGAKRTEVTARGKLVRELESKSDTPGGTVKLTIDAGLQAYASRRLGRESGSVVVIDCNDGGILAMTSMPSFDPNSFSDGIGRLEWKMLRDDDHIPLLNKVLQGLYPPGSTLKPMAALALLAHGVDPEETVSCGGGYRLGNRFFRCLGRHGPMNMRNAIMKSCNTYFYAMGRRIGYDLIAPVARELGLGQEFDLPVASQRYGTVPDSAWKQKKYKKEWSQSDTLNATIGQGYVLTSPFQLAVMAARIASGRKLKPRLLANQKVERPPLPYPKEHFDVVREGMDRVVNANGTAVRSRLQVEGVKMGGKTGTAQVRAIRGSQRGQSGAWKYRDHGLFVCFAPTENPRFACAVVIDHGLGGARAAAPVAKDVLTYLYDPEQAMKTLTSLEAGWGGNIHDRMKKQRDAFMAANDPAAMAAMEAAKAQAEAANAAAEAQNAASNASANQMANASEDAEKPKVKKAEPKPVKPIAIETPRPAAPPPAAAAPAPQPAPVSPPPAPPPVEPIG